MFLPLRCTLLTTPLSRSSRSALTMPLRAKILNSTFATQRTAMPSPPPLPAAYRPDPTDPPDDVLFNTVYGARTIELNRPSKLNALSGSMIRKIVPRLQEYRFSQLASVIILSGSGPKAFCAGGDVQSLALQNGTAEGRQASKDYFGLEYVLDHLLATYSHPVVAYMDGITMGGGVGLSVHAPFRIATEKTVFAMPETAIGFFPDVGGSFFLPRMDGAVGTYLALTGERIKGYEAVWLGLATHYVDSSMLSQLTGRLAELVFRDYEEKKERCNIIDKTIQEFGMVRPGGETVGMKGEIRKAVDRCFSADTIEEVIERLRQEQGTAAAWAERTLGTLNGHCPFSLKVTIRQMRLGKRWSLRETFEREFHMAGLFMERQDFVEGVTAKLTKPIRTPKWEQNLEDISDADVDRYFVMQGQQRFQLLSEEGNFVKYQLQMGLPTEEEVERVVREERVGRGELLDLFGKKMRGKYGVREKVVEVVERMCGVDQEGKLVWNDGEVRG